VLAGDDRQLASIERGGLFTELRRRHGSAVIRQVERQRVPWQREAAQDLSEGRFARAVQAFDRHGAVTWSADDGANLQALVQRWQADTLADPQATRFVFAYTNQEADALNAGLREVLRGRGALGPDVRLDTRHGPASFAVGDRVQFTATAKRLGLFNGNAGVITGLDAATGVVAARLDGGRQVSWQASVFDGVRHGYAGTIYKGQGRTLDHTYLLHGRHWRAASSYVALTRQRHGARVFVSRAVARDAGQLARQMARGEVRAASVAWATAAELAASPRRLAAAAAARAGAVRQAAALGVQVVVERDDRRLMWGGQTASLAQVLEKHQALRAVQAALPGLRSGVARLSAELPGRVAEAVRAGAAQRARVEAMAAVRWAAEAVAARAGVVRQAAARGVQRMQKRVDDRWQSFQEPVSLPGLLGRRRTEQAVQAVLPGLAAGVTRLAVGMPGQVARAVQAEQAAEAERARLAREEEWRRQREEYVARMAPVRARLLQAGLEAWWAERGVPIWEQGKRPEEAEVRRRLERDLNQMSQADLLLHDQVRARREREAEQARQARRSGPSPGM